MEGFVTRKKRRLDFDSESDVNTDTRPEDEESTDVKLAMLSSLHSGLDQELLLDLLLAHNGSVLAASESLNAPAAPVHHPAKKPTPRTVGPQTSLRAFAVTTVASGKQSQSRESHKKAKLLSKKGATLHLYDPLDIGEHTPCTVLHNFLPADEANDLLTELLEESKTFRKITFKLFDNVVSSPHTSGFYVGSDYELTQQKSEYVYNGARLEDVRKLTPHLERVKPRVQEAVNREIQERIRTKYGGKKLKYQSPNPWCPNAAFVNCYNAPEENVGWHSDQLTYLGPRAVIGSLSLGVTREFRVRRILPRDSSDDAAEENSGGQIAIHLPHNSLLIMHAEMQEEWKHSVSPAQTVDPHPLSGNARINITYRDYKPAFHPRHTPRCRCGIATVLRVVQRTNRNDNLGRYFWMCYAGNVPGQKGCSFFQWVEFDDNGLPILPLSTSTATTAGGVSSSSSSSTSKPVW
ncbi:GRF zinc finger domain-containing protein [Apodospora peruviana]|uniref:GRF zinc finger domain-containing protein n=1 Tax=Apodospora peruviana TaxID=516989 RepID=A0AAE0I4Z5_9PEZI|nr:GRF zinc finger domain-containing protein [Apodospora peruviana]